MKNELTSEEWLVLSDYLEFGEGVFFDWEQDKNFKENSKLLESAEKKVKNVAENIRKRS
ncbi:hypothetical protein JZO72_03780 [Vagococcus fluvialis]|uniref:hypothetical protein n=1 Tax=Vagococcus fluvialis TaxID=2738 RepID=UPI001A8C3EA5|nr:hypothetical protein [Vagococcus fluvialis]MBO0478741.1 hypothetical protein [Vagococcus fluvialis]MBO0484414.1 hypothetical protein [Vagococcus fluvialis]